MAGVELGRNLQFIVRFLDFHCSKMTLYMINNDKTHFYVPDAVKQGLASFCIYSTYFIFNIKMGKPGTELGQAKPLLGLEVRI